MQKTTLFLHGKKSIDKSKRFDEFILQNVFTFKNRCDKIRSPNKFYTSHSRSVRFYLIKMHAPFLHTFVV